MVRTSADARDRLMEWCRHHGITLSALLQAASLRLPHDDELSTRDKQIIEDARTIDAESRRRD